MPEFKQIVINTSPIISIVAALGDLSVLQDLYDRVNVPFEVSQEILVDNASRFAAPEFEADTWLSKENSPLEISPFLLNSLDRGEAAVIQLALDRKIGTACIDESVGRRFARLSGLSVTGTIGILIRARQSGYPLSMKDAIQKMQTRGIRLSQAVIDFALDRTEE